MRHRLTTLAIHILKYLAVLGVGYSFGLPVWCFLLAFVLFAILDIVEITLWMR